MDENGPSVKETHFPLNHSLWEQGVFVASNIYFSPRSLRFFFVDFPSVDFELMIVLHHRCLVCFCSRKKKTHADIHARGLVFCCSGKTKREQENY